MGGKTSKSTQTVSIPPEVLARYNAVNARAEQVAGTPFQPYSYNPADFVAQLTPTQLAGIQNVNYAAGQAQPYYEEATNQLMGAQMGAVPYYAQAGQDIGFGQQMGLGFQQQAVQDLYGGRAAAQPLQQAAGFNIGAAQDIGSQLAQQAYMQQAQAGAAAQPLQGLSLDTLMRAGMTGEGVSGQALSSLAQAGYTAAPLQQLAQGIYGQAYQAAQPYTQAALQQYYGGLGAAGPLSQAAQQNIAAAQAGAAPYQQFATQLGLAAARPVMPEALTGAQVQQYISPYLSNVVSQTQALMNQQAQQAQAEQLGNAIRSGAFGGDRSRIAAANLAQQQQLAQGKVISDLLQSGYGQALATAQQQQQLGLGAEQANRAAQQAAAGQLLGVGQAGFGQGMTAAQQQAALAQQLFGQQAAAGQNIAGLGQQAFTQGMTTGQAQQALAQQLFGQGATTAQQQAAIAQQLFGQGATQAQQQAALAQQIFGQGMSQAQQQAALSQLLFGQGTTAAQQQAALGQQLFGQGLAASERMGGLGQQGFAQQLAAAQARQGLGQGLYGMGAGTAQQLAALGTGAQGAALTGAQAQLAAGQAQQQTAQAGLQALYNQFLQQQAYPYQAAQFLANIATGTGALSGSTQTAVTPGGLLSDVRMKENIRKVGETFDKQPIYSYNYKGDDKTQMGMLAQEVEQKHPEAVGLAGGMKTVDYDKATRNSVRKPVTIDGEYTSSEGGPVLPHRAGEGFARGGYADGGMPGLASPTDMAALLAAQAQMFGPFSQAGRQTGGLPGMGGYVPAANLPVSELVTPGPMPEAPDAIGQMQKIADIGKTGNEIYEKYKEKQAEKSAAKALNTTQANPVVSSDRRAAADGGAAVMPYTADQTTALNIPSQKMETKKLDVPEMPKGRSAMDDVAAIANIAATVMSMSDSRVKEDIKHIGNTYDGQKIYSYRYKGEPQTHIGLLAQEVEKKHPEAVGNIKGVKMVDYDMATEEAAKRAVDLARGKADGGAAMPYSTPTSLGIPMGDLGGRKLDVPDMPEGRSALDDLSKLASTASDIKSATTKPKKYAGGRTGYATDGTVRRTGATGSFEEESLMEKLKRVAKEIPQDIREMAGYGFTPESAAAQREKLGPFSRNYVPAPAGAAATAPPFVTQQEPGLAAAPAPRPRKETPANVARPVDNKDVFPASAFANLPETPAEGLAGATGQSPGVPPAPTGLVPSAPASVSSEADLGLAPMLGGTVKPTKAEVIAKDRSAPVENRMSAFLDWVKQPQNFIPLATGIAAATAAPTRNTFVALAQGLGAGAQAYQPVLQKQADLESTKAQTLRERIQTAKEAITEIGGVRYFLGADGRYYTAGDWRAAGRPALIGGTIAAQQAELEAKRLGAETPPAGAPAPAAPTDTTPVQAPAAFTPDAAAMQRAAQENAQMSDLTSDQRSLRAATNQEIISNAIAARNAAVQTGNAINESARAFMPMFKEGVLTAGTGIDQRANFFNGVNTLLRIVGFSPNEEISAALSDKEVADKFSLLLSGQRAQSLDQRAYAALESLGRTVPQGTMQKDAVARLLADLYVTNQRDIDMANYIDRYSSSQPENIIAQNAAGEFNRQYGEIYEKDRKMLEQLLNDVDPQTGEPIINYLFGVGQNKDLQKVRTAAAFEKRYPGVTRYLYRQ